MADKMPGVMVPFVSRFISYNGTKKSYFANLYPEGIK